MPCRVRSYYVLLGTLDEFAADSKKIENKRQILGCIGVIIYRWEVYNRGVSTRKGEQKVAEIIFIIGYTLIVIGYMAVIVGHLINI